VDGRNETARVQGGIRNGRDPGLPFAYGATTGLVEDFMYEGITEAYLLDVENRRFLKENNPWALKDMAEKMLEAIQRKLWKSPGPETRQGLQDIFLDSEAGLESRG
jgi:cobaltochelatase CobN